MIVHSWIYSSLGCCVVSFQTFCRDLGQKVWTQISSPITVYGRQPSSLILVQKIAGGHSPFLSCVHLSAFVARNTQRYWNGQAFVNCHHSAFNSEYGVWFNSSVTWWSPRISLSTWLMCKKLKDRRHFFLTVHHNFIFLIFSVAMSDGVKSYTYLQ